MSTPSPPTAPAGRQPSRLIHDEIRIAVEREWDDEQLADAIANQVEAVGYIDRDPGEPEDPGEPTLDDHTGHVWVRFDAWREDRGPGDRPKPIPTQLRFITPVDGCGPGVEQAFAADLLQAVVTCHEASCRYRIHEIEEV